MRRATLGVVLMALLAGCSPDAPHDNPYDVAQTGIYGTTYSSSGALPGVLITASPANVTASSDGQGRYSLELTPGSDQVVQYSKAGYQTDVDTVTVPDRGLTQHNVILSGQPTIDTAIIKTFVQRLYSGALYYYIKPYLVVHHPDGGALLDSFKYYCQIDTITRELGMDSSRGHFTRIYSIDISSIPGVSDLHNIVGHLGRFMISSSSFSSLTGNKVIPAFLDPAPDNLVPSGVMSFTPPDTLRWTNGRSDVDIRVEVWRTSTMVWYKATTNIDKLLLDTTLTTGNYYWKVIAHDASGNQARAEATFTRP